MRTLLVKRFKYNFTDKTNKTSLKWFGNIIINGKYIGRKTKYQFQSFDNEQEAIKFENEKRALNKLQRKQQRQSKTKEQRRAEGLLTSGGNSECESEAIRQLVKLLENEWNIMLIRDGAHNDIVLQKKDSPDTDLYYGVQIKSCSKQTANGTAQNTKSFI